MNDNPYQQPTAPPDDVPAPKPSLQLTCIWTGPIIGAAVGITHVATLVCLASLRGYTPIFRTPDVAFINAVLLAVSGAVFGLVYGSVLAFVCRLMSLVVRPRLHFYSAILASIVFTAIALELTLRNVFVVDPTLVFVLVAGCSFVIAITTSRKTEC